MRHSRLVLGVIAWVGVLSLAPLANAGIADARLAKATPGKCVSVSPACAAYGQVPVLNEDCSPLKLPNGAPLCQTYVSYYCAAGFQTLYRSKAGLPYFLQSDAAALDETLTSFTVSTPTDCRPPRSEACLSSLDRPARTHLVKGWYCKMLKLVQSLFEDEDQLIDRLRDNGGLIARFNSTFGGSPSLSDLKGKLAGYRRTLRSELNEFYQDELNGRRIVPGYYENRLRVLKELNEIREGISGKVNRAGMDMVRTAERGEALAKKVQKVLIKVAGYAVFAFTGGNRIAQCLTEAGIEAAADAVTQKLKGQELTLSGVGKNTLRTLIFRCADALTGGPGGDILGMLTGGFTDMLKDLGNKIKSKMRGFWKTLASKVGWVVDKLSFLMDDAVVRVFSHAAEEVVVEFGMAAFPDCLLPLFKKDWQGAFRCLGSAARKAIGIGVPRGLFDSALDLIERNVPAAKNKLAELAKFAGLDDDATVKGLLTGLSVAAKGAIANARKCRDLIEGFSSIRPVFTCVARAFGKLPKVEALAPLALWEILQSALSSAEDKVMDKLRDQRVALSEGLQAMGISMPETLLSMLRAGAGEAARGFVKAARGCLPKAGSMGKLSDGARMTVTCLGQAARTAFGNTGHALVAALLAEVAKAGEKNAAALAEVLADVVQRARVVVDDLALIPAPVQDAVRRAKGTKSEAAVRTFAAVVRKSCVRAAGKGESLRVYIRASARCLSDAATSALRAAGAAILTKALGDLRQWITQLGKEKGDVGAAVARRLGAIGDLLSVDVAGLPTAAEVQAVLAQDAKVFTRKLGACVGELSAEANVAAQKHERLTSMARALRGAIVGFGRCVARAAPKLGNTGPGKKAPKPEKPKAAKAKPKAKT